GSVFLGRDLIEQRNYSDEVAGAIDREVQEIVENARKWAAEALSKHRHKLETLAHAIVERETLNADELEQLWGDLPKPQSSAGQVPEFKGESDQPAQGRGSIRPLPDVAAASLVSPLPVVLEEPS
ncbi:MAG: hypothetical protein ACUVX1_18230, partial [Chloroflexota bacterium]